MPFFVQNGEKFVKILTKSKLYSIIIKVEKREIIMKRFICAILIFAVVLGLSACIFAPVSPSTTTSTSTTVGGGSGNGTSVRPTTSTTTTTTKPSGSTSGGSTSADEAPDLSVFDADELAVFYTLFDTETHVSIRLDISDSELAKLQADYEKYSSRGSKSPIYRMADMYITLTDGDGIVSEYKLEQVGVRMKGNTSRTSFYNDNDGMYNLVHFKISFQETFDDEEYYGSDALVWDKDARKARKDRTFATLSKLDIRWNRNDDTTYIRERYAYDFYRSVGVLAPHVNLASVDIGGDHAGVWCIYEPIDKSFLKKNLPASAIGGDLYKLGWAGGSCADFTGAYSYGVEDEDSGSFYVYDLKTNKKSSDHSSLKTLMSTLNSGKLTREKFSSLVDEENFLAYTAASYIIGNPDDLRNNYNNTYIYFRADTGKMLVIPYDMDRGFGVNTWNPYGNGMTTDSPFADRNVCGSQRNPLFTKTIQDGGFLVDEFVAALSEMSQNPMLSPEVFAAEFEAARRLYSAETATSKVYSNGGSYRFAFDLDLTCDASSGANMSFSDYITAKLETLAKHIRNYAPSGDGDEGDGDGDGDEVVRPVQKPDSDYSLYIRADFTGWNVDGNYKMSNTSEGVFSITLTRGSEFQFKLYDSVGEKWFGGELISEECEVDHRLESDHRNIILAAGTYLIEFHTATGEIFIFEK